MLNVQCKVTNIIAQNAPDSRLNCKLRIAIRHAYAAISDYLTKIR